MYVYRIIIHFVEELQENGMEYFVYMFRIRLFKPKFFSSRLSLRREEWGAERKGRNKMRGKGRGFKQKGMIVLHVSHVISSFLAYGLRWREKKREKKRGKWEGKKKSRQRERKKYIYNLKEKKEKWCWWSAGDKKKKNFHEPFPIVFQKRQISYS